MLFAGKGNLWIGEAGLPWEGRKGFGAGWSFSVFLMLGNALTIGLSGQETVIGNGHYDLAINYEAGSGWDSYIRDFDAGVELSPASIVYELDEDARRVIPNDPDFSILGQPGDFLWVLPEIYNPEIVFLGIGAPLLGRNLFSGGLSNRGQVTMRLVDVSGTGPDAGGTVSMWQSGFPPRFFFSTADGIGPDDALEEITANFHAHFNWGFTKAGLYRITFEYSGILVAELGGEFVSTMATYTFQVGHAGDDSPLRYGWEVGNGWIWSTWMGFVYVGVKPWVYRNETGWAYLPDGSPDTYWSWMPDYGWVWSEQRIFPWIWSVEEDAFVNLSQ